MPWRDRGGVAPKRGKEVEEPGVRRAPRDLTGGPNDPRAEARARPRRRETRSPSRREIARISIAVAVLVTAALAYLHLTAPLVKYETFVDENYSFGFDYPADWVFSEQGYAFGAVENTSDEGRGYVMMLVVRAEPGSTLNSVYERLVAENRENFELMEGPIDFAVDDTQALKFSVKERRGDATIRSEWVIAIRDGHVYSFSAGIGEERFPDYRAVLEHVIDSFSFLEG